MGDGGVDVSAGWEEVSPGSGAGGGGGDWFGGGGFGNGNGNGFGSGNGGGAGADEPVPDGLSWVPVAADADGGGPVNGTVPRLVLPVPGDPAAAPEAPVCQPQTPCDPALVVRVNDLVSIDADPPTQGMEPDGWLVVGVPTNFYASAAPHSRSGPLLGSPAEVRFMPVGYTWDYGDGTSGSTATGGASWAAQGLPEFSETSTSHIYESTGTLTIGLTVSYAAEYRFDGGAWRPVDGLLEVSGSPMTAIADRSGTVLVAEECSANPGGPGCR